MRAIVQIARIDVTVRILRLEFGSLLMRYLQNLTTRRTVARGTLRSHCAIESKAVARCCFINNLINAVKLALLKASIKNQE
jgi:hypothetical protein